MSALILTFYQLILKTGYAEVVSQTEGTAGRDQVPSPLSVALRSLRNFLVNVGLLRY